MKADYHFHPNLHAKKPEKRLERIWEAISKHQLNAIICTEHVYKNAPDAYRRLVESKPADAKAHIFPGAELITRDGKGIEVIAFAEEDWYDEHPKLLEPFAFTLSEILGYLEKTDLHYFIPHPFLPGNPLRQFYPEKNAMNGFLRSLPAFEVSNGCYLLLEYFLDCIRFKKIANALRQSVQIRLSGISERERAHRFIAVGSDAHHPRDMGFCVEIPSAKGIGRHDAFSLITSNCDVRMIHIPKQALSLRHLLYTCWTTFSEYWMKREWRRYGYHHTSFSFKR